MFEGRANNGSGYNTGEMGKEYTKDTAERSNRIRGFGNGKKRDGR
jgi:hypothetical protein